MLKVLLLVSVAFVLVSGVVCSRVLFAVVNSDESVESVVPEVKESTEGVVIESTEVVGVLGMIGALRVVGVLWVAATKLLESSWLLKLFSTVL